MPHTAEAYKRENRRNQELWELTHTGIKTKADKEKLIELTNPISAERLEQLGKSKPLSEEEMATLAKPANPNFEHKFLGIYLATPMMHAARHGDIDTLSLFMKLGADVNYRTSDQGKSALLAAIQHADTTTVAFLLGCHKAKEDTTDDLFPLHAAASFLRADLIPLLEKIYDINAHNRQGKTPLEILSKNATSGFAYTPYSSSVYDIAQLQETTRTFLDHDADPSVDQGLMGLFNVSYEDREATKAFMSMLLGYPTVCEARLNAIREPVVLDSYTNKWITQGISAKTVMQFREEWFKKNPGAQEAYEKESGPYNPIIVACDSHDPEIIKQVIESCGNSSISTPDPHGNTALAIITRRRGAHEQQHVVLAQLLIASGATPDVGALLSALGSTKFNEHSLALVGLCATTDNINLSAGDPAKSPLTSLIKYMLRIEQLGISPEEKTRAHQNSNLALEHLLSLGARIDKPDAEGKSAFRLIVDHAKTAESTEQSIALATQLRKQDESTAALENPVMTPLMWLISKGNFNQNTAELAALLSTPKSTNKVNFGGETPLQALSEKADNEHHRAIVDTLLEKGAVPSIQSTNTTTETADETATSPSNAM